MDDRPASQTDELRLAIDAIVRAFKIADDITIANAPKLNPSDVQAILFIRQHDRCTANDVAGFLGVVPTTNSAIIDRLVRRGLLARNRTDTNRRIVQLSLTKEGHETAEAIIAEQNAHCAQMLDRLDSDERMHFVAAMTKIASSLP